MSEEHTLKLKKFLSQMSNSDIEIEYRRMKGETIDSNVAAEEIKPSVIS